MNKISIDKLSLWNILKEIEFDDLSHPICKGLCKYLDIESNFPEGWIFTIESNNAFPHADFYNYNETYNKTESIGIFLGLSSFIIEHYRDSIIYNEIIATLNKYISLMYDDNLGDMGPTGYITLVNTMKKVNLQGYDYEKLENRLKELVNRSIQRNPHQWLNYGYRPSDYIKSQNSMFYFDNKDIVDVELDFLIDTLPENDVWPISWSWFGNNKLYPKESTISENWCKANKAIDRSLFLKNFDRLL